MCESKATNESDSLICPKCGKKIKPDDKEHARGRIKDGDPVGNGGELGRNIVDKHYGGTFKNHPFYLKNLTMSKDDRNGIEAHHLNSSASFRQKPRYGHLALFLGYNINYWKNGVLLTKVMHVACHFGVPLHKGGHGATFIVKGKGKDIDSLAGLGRGVSNWTFDTENQEEVVLPVYDKANELTERKYEQHVNKLVGDICRQYIEEEDLCNKTVKEREDLAANFINALDKLSQSIFRELFSFRWTLTSDGFDYALGGIGCCRKKYLYEKRKRIKDKLKDSTLDAFGARDLMTSIYSDASKADKIKDGACEAGMLRHADDITNNNRAYFLERKNISPFKFD